MEHTHEEEGYSAYLTDERRSRCVRSTEKAPARCVEELFNGLLGDDATAKLANR